MAVLDTGILIDLTRSPRSAGFRAARARFLDFVQAGEPICTTRLDTAELYVGIELGGNKPAEIERVERVLSGMRILDFDESGARRFGFVEAHLRRLGRPAGEIDTIIAAICLVNGQRLVTRNVKHFIDVPGLKVDNY